jgi:hypothetical protein
MDILTYVIKIKHIYLFEVLQKGSLGKMFTLITKSIIKLQYLSRFLYESVTTLISCKIKALNNNQIREKITCSNKNPKSKSK